MRICNLVPLGKPFLLELQNLSRTYEWALKYPIDELQGFVRDSFGFPLYTIGSGGSFTAANFASTFHQYVGGFSEALTPLEFLQSQTLFRETAIMLFTAGGRNHDVLSSFSQAAQVEPRELAAICTRKNTPLAKLATNYSYARMIELDVPTKKDGFLATNSLLATILVVARSYIENFSLPYALETSLAEQLHSDLPKMKFDELVSQVKPLLNKNTLIVLYDNWTKCAALDAESKFSESGLCNIQLADFRNFGHGRHNWLDKNKRETGIIALISPSTTELADKMLKLIPKSIPILRMTTSQDGPLASLAPIIQLMYVLKIFGDYKRIDPGRPGVPEFGRRIYNVKVPIFRKGGWHGAGLQFPAISRKLNLPFALIPEEQLSRWLTSLQKFVSLVEAQKFGSIVFDYDGTLCEPRNRYRGISQQIAEKLVELLDSGLSIGIATGRGKSVREDLQAKIPRVNWTKIFVGYYNCSDIGRLDDEKHPSTDKPLNGLLQPIEKKLRNEIGLDKIAKIEVRPNQISVESRQFYSLEYLRRVIENIVYREDRKEIMMLESTHSIDIIPSDVSKTNLLDFMKSLTNGIKEGSTLCIGDRGRWPGNDYFLLSTPFSLSVDTVSGDLCTCWNLAPLGCRGEQAVMHYLNQIKLEKGYFSLRNLITEEAIER